MPGVHDISDHGTVRPHVTDHHRNDPEDADGVDPGGPPSNRCAHTQMVAEPPSTWRVGLFDGAEPVDSAYRCRVSFRPLSSRDLHYCTISAMFSIKHSDVPPTASLWKAAQPEMLPSRRPYTSNARNSCPLVVSHHRILILVALPLQHQCCLIAWHCESHTLGSLKLLPQPPGEQMVMSVTHDER